MTKKGNTMTSLARRLGVTVGLAVAPAASLTFAPTSTPTHAAISHITAECYRPRPLASITTPCTW